jgi:pimeloyl-ACP methyl ester carboxylesterase
MAVPIKTVKTEHFDMDYFTFGRGKKTMVIVPGVSVKGPSANADVTVEAYDPLTDDFTIYVFDRRKDLPAAYTIWDAARDTAKAMTALNLKNVYLLGTSQGGRIAMAIAIKQPELVEKLVLASTSARLGQDQYALFDRWISFAESGDALGLYMSFGETLYPEYMLEDFKQMLIDEAKTVTTDELRRFVIILSEGKQVFDPTSQLKEIACPVLVIGGIDDQVMGSDAGLYIAKHLAPQKDVVLQLYDGYGHMPYDLAPDFKERLKRFFLS